MMLGIGLGLMAILCAVGLIAAGGLFMHHGTKDEQKKDQQVIQQDHKHGQAAESSPESFNEGQKTKDRYPEKQPEEIPEGGK